MKKTLALILAVAMMLVAVVGCTANQPAATTEPAAEAATEPAVEAAPAEAEATAEPAAEPVETVTLKLGTTGATTGTIYLASTYFADAVKEVSDGAMEIEVIGAGALGTTAQHYAQLREGSLDIFITALDTGTTMTGGEDFAVCVVPYLFQNQEHFAKFMESDVLASMMDKVTEANKVYYLGAMGFNFPRGLSCTFPVNSVDDVKNLKIRVPETASMMRVWEAWGANPQIIASKELYTSLENGMIDAQENDLMTSFNNGWLEVAKNYMELEYIQQGNILYLSSLTWEKLSDQQKAWLEAGRKQAHEKFNADMADKYESIKAEAIAAGVQFVDCDTTGFRSKAAEAAQQMDGELWTAGLYQQVADLAK